MDYAEKYKAVLKTATLWIKDGCTDKEKICLESVFPELRESEDERIRKKLYNTVLGTPNDNEWFQDISKDAVLAYLEKQKEQKPAEWSEDIIQRAVKEVGLTQHQIDWFKTNVFPPKQEWSEEDEAMKDNILRVLSSFVGTVECESNPSLSTTYPTYMREIDWLKSLRPPQDRCEDCPHRGDMFLLTQGIKSGKHDLAITFMNYLDENRPEGKMSLSNAECEDIDNAFKENDWAKIVRYVDKYRPSWKPSEELIGCLERVMAFKNPEPEDIKGCEELCEQLKKLM